MSNKVERLQAQLASTSQPSESGNSGASPVFSGDGRRGSQILPAHDTGHFQSAYNISPEVYSDDTVPSPPDIEARIDMLATQVFDSLPSRSIGYFGMDSPLWNRNGYLRLQSGPSSNHALFRTLATEMSHLGYRSTRCPPEEGNHAIPTPPKGPAHLALIDPESSKAAFPPRQKALSMIAWFFDTVGTVFPFVSETILIQAIHNLDQSENSQEAFSPDVEALLSIVLAHALHTLDEASPEPFYNRALSLTNSQNPCFSSLESCISPTLCIHIHQYRGY